MTDTTDTPPATEARLHIVAALQGLADCPELPPLAITGPTITVTPASDWIEPLALAKHWLVRLRVCCWVPHYDGAQALAELEQLACQAAIRLRDLNGRAAAFSAPQLIGSGADQESLTTEITVTVTVRQEP